MQIYDCVIVGGGPGGVAAGVYAARKKLSTLLITDSFGGQSLVSSDIQNWIGVPSISGYDLGKMLETHVRSFPSLQIKEGDLVKSVTHDVTKNIFTLTTERGDVFFTKTILLTSGSRRKKLNVPGEKQFESKGVYYCSICDAPLFQDKKVVVVGGGNSAFEAIRDLLPYASSITLLHRSEVFRADPVTQEKIRAEQKVSFITNVAIEEIKGNALVENIIYRDLTSNIQTTLSCDGVFVEIGSQPNTEMVVDLIEKNTFGEIMVDHKTQATSLRGIWAAGDVTDMPYKQNNISVGDAIKAVLNIYDFFHSTQ